MLSTTSQKIGGLVLVCTVMVAVFMFYAFFAREVTHWMEGVTHLSLSLNTSLPLYHTSLPLNNISPSL